MRRKTILRVIGYLFCSLFSLAFSVATIYLVYNYTISSFAYGKELGESYIGDKPSIDVEIAINDDATIDEVAKILKEKNVISNTFIFKIESILKGTDYNFTGGVYVVNTSMNSNELNTALRHNDLLSKDVKITINEGFTVKDIAEYLENKEIVTAEEFLNECNTGEFSYNFLNNIPQRENRLEGYLFPDTYLISENADSREIINKMLTRFDEIYSEEYKERAEELGLTLDEVITMASIIEKEIRVPEERAKASAVIYNRLNQNMKLQMCSTVIYVLDKRKDRLLDADLQVQSPYNTYLNEGLPLGPISNPGKACIEAALYPNDDDFLYFVVKNEETGEHFFTNKYEDFTDAKVLYKQKF